MMKVVHVFIDRQELIGYTDLTLKRSKSDLTGELNISVFMGWLPDAPVLGGATRGREVLVYIGGHLAFTGTIDRRSDTAERKRARSANGRFSGGFTASAGGSSGSLNIGPDSYTVKFTCRGKTKELIDSSHQHPTGTILRTSNREVFETLVEPWGYEIDWQADEIPLDRVRLRDGAHVVDEIQRIAEMCGLYVFETREGVLRVTDGPSENTGEPIALGTNILSFNTDQIGDMERSEVQVKGQLTDQNSWGESAVLPTLKRVANTTVSNFSPLTVQVYGNATPEIIDKRLGYEANKRATAAKKIDVEVFHVLQTDGTPWDIGDVHYVEIPPAGVFGNFEIIELTYHVDATNTLKTDLTLGTTQIKTATGPAQYSLLSGLAELAGGPQAQVGRASTLVSSALQSAWSGPVLGPVSELVEKVNDALSSASDATEKPLLTLPRGFEGGEM